MRRTLLLALVLLLAAPAPGRGQELVPLGAEGPVTFQGYTKDWVKCAVARDGSRYFVAWEWVVNHDVWGRLFDPFGLPLGPEIKVNDPLTGHIQDEPMVAVDDDGNVLVCWSDRNDYDGGAMGTGEAMGCFARVFDANGVAYGPPFQVNAVAAKSQWEPMPCALPGGGWVVAFNGDSDGNAYLRFFDTDGAPRTGDIGINTVFNNGQTEAEVSVSPAGVVLAVYADFGGNVQAGTGTNLLVRRFSSTGAVLDPVEQVVNGTTLPFDQLEPRIDVDGAGRFVVVWEDWGADGSGAAVYARRYGQDGVPLGPEWRVNISTVGHQRLPEVACAADGRFVVVWQDDGPGIFSRIVGRVYRADGTPAEGGEIVVLDMGTGGRYRRPQIALDASGTLAVVTADSQAFLGFSPTPPNNPLWGDGQARMRRFELTQGDVPVRVEPGARAGGARAAAGPARPGQAAGPLPAVPLAPALDGP